jgi:hypothetical protein
VPLERRLHRRARAGHKLDEQSEVVAVVDDKVGEQLALDGEQRRVAAVWR